MTWPTPKEKSIVPESKRLALMSQPL